MHIVETFAYRLTALVIDFAGMICYNTTGSKNRLLGSIKYNLVINMTGEKHEWARHVFEHYGPVVKTNTLRDNKLNSRDVAELISDGLIRRIKTGYYLWTATENDLSDLELVSSIIPKGIICLQSAAYYYDLSTINPIAVTIAISSDSMEPTRPSHPPIELVVMPAAQFELGLIEKPATLRIYNKERTVCDFFRKRNTLGSDLALEVLKNYMKGKRNLQLLLEYAGKLRVKSVIKPYVEALI